MVMDGWCAQLFMAGALTALGYSCWEHGIQHGKLAALARLRISRAVGLDGQFAAASAAGLELLARRGAGDAGVVDLLVGDAQSIRKTWASKKVSSA